MTAPRYKVTSWSGRTNYECRLCPFKVLDRGRMVQHVRRAHPTLAELGGELDALGAVPFASPKAEDTARELSLTSIDFHGSTPTGAAGFTTDDVRRLAPRPQEEARQ